jgi:hypothetical protein
MRLKRPEGREMPTKIPASVRFWTHVEKTDTCWNWTAALNKTGGTGYGVFNDGISNCVRAHRFSWELNCGPIPEGLSVLHKCDNRRCVNPGHLFIGTQLDNMRDRNAKGRGPKGETRKHIPTGDEHWMRRRPDLVPRGNRNGNCKISDEQVAEIRNSPTKTTRELSVIFGAAPVTIRQIRSGRTRRTLGARNAAEATRQERIAKLKAAKNAK